MSGLLRALLAGQPLGEALQTLDPTTEDANRVMVWFRQWVSGGFFAGFEIRSSESGAPVAR